MKPLTGAACATTAHADEIFLGEHGRNPGLHSLALHICSGCPVNQDCYLEAMRLGNAAHGIWAGTTANQRAETRRKATTRKPPA